MAKRGGTALSRSVAAVPPAKATATGTSGDPGQLRVTRRVRLPEPVDRSGLFYKN